MVLYRPENWKLINSWKRFFERLVTLGYFIVPYIHTYIHRRIPHVVFLAVFKNNLTIPSRTDIREHKPSITFHMTVHTYTYNAPGKKLIQALSYNAVLCVSNLLHCLDSFSAPSIIYEAAACTARCGCTNSTQHHPITHFI